MAQQQLRFHNIHFTYDSLAGHLFEGLSFSLAPGWTGIVGPNGSGKSTLLSLAAGEIQPSAGSIEAPPGVAVCHQRTDDIPEGLSDLLCYPDAGAGELASILGIQADWLYRWDTLSHGERKRAQIGVALWLDPDMLLVDEPTNHLDMEARGMVRTALTRFSGIGLLVSHDRTLMDHLCAQCLFLSPFHDPVIRPGGVSAGLAEQEREDQEKRREFEKIAAQEKRLLAEVSRRRGEADVTHQNRKRSKRGLRWKDSDAREKIDRARISGSDGQAGRLLKQMEGRMRQMADRRERIGPIPQARTGVRISGSTARGDAVLRCPVTSIPLGHFRALDVPELEVAPTDRIGLVGPNGSGKSTLLGYIGQVSGISDREDVVFVPQEVSQAETRRLIDTVRRLENRDLGSVLSTVSRLGSDPEHLLETELPSPGEARKVMLALGLQRDPALVIMDEPTNHMDLTSMRCIEDALKDFPGALLLVSHDRAFLASLVSTYWVVDVLPGGQSRLAVGRELPG